MHKLILRHFMLLVLILAAITGLISDRKISAQTPPCEEISISDQDASCGYLAEKLLERTNPHDGIDLTPETDQGNVQTMYVEFDTTEVGTRTWWDGSSSFTWTFDASAITDPKLAFDDNLTTHTGMFEVEATVAEDASNFAGKFHLYQNANVVGDSYPFGTESTFVYDATTENIFQLTDPDIIFIHGSPDVTGTNFLAEMNKCYLIRPDDGSGKFYVVSDVVDDEHLILTSNYVNPSELNYEGTADGLQRACDKMGTAPFYKPLSMRV